MGSCGNFDAIIYLLQAYKNLKILLAADYFSDLASEAKYLTKLADTNEHHQWDANYYHPNKVLLIHYLFSKRKLKNNKAWKMLILFKLVKSSLKLEVKILKITTKENKSANQATANFCLIAKHSPDVIWLMKAEFSMLELMMAPPAQKKRYIAS